MLIYLRAAWANKVALGSLVLLVVGIVTWAAEFLGLIEPEVRPSDILGPVAPIYLYALVYGSILLAGTLPFTMKACRRAFRSLALREGEQDDRFVRAWTGVPYCDRVGFRLAVRQWAREHSSGKQQK